MDRLTTLYLIYFVACTLLGMWLEVRIGKLKKLIKERDEGGAKSPKPLPMGKVESDNSLGGDG